MLRGRAARRSGGSCRGRSGMVTASTASRCSPISARSATKRSRSKFMFAPQATAISVSPLTPVAADVRLHARDRQRAGRLQDRAGVLEDVLDRGADRVGVDEDHVVDERRATRNVSSPTLFTADAVGEQAHVGQRHPAAWPERPRHRVRLFGCTPITLISGRRRFTYAAMPAIRPPPPMGDEDGVDGPGVLAQDLHPDRALAGDDVRDRRRDGRTSSSRRAPASSRGVRLVVRSPSRITSAPRAATASTLIRGVVTGMTMVARHPSRWAASATPCAWLPAEAAITPRSTPRRGARAILL